ncbi:hypothetical protein ACJX0J_009393 [Zea mays]
MADASREEDDDDQGDTNGTSSIVKEVASLVGKPIAMAHVKGFFTAEGPQQQGSGGGRFDRKGKEAEMKHDSSHGDGRPGGSVGHLTDWDSDFSMGDVEQRVAIAEGADLNNEDMDILSKPFEEEEIKQAIDSMLDDSALGLNGFGSGVVVLHEAMINKKWQGLGALYPLFTQELKKGTSLGSILNLKSIIEVPLTRLECSLSQGGDLVTWVLDKFRTDGGIKKYIKKSGSTGCL